MSDINREYGPLTIEQAASNVASHLGILMLTVRDTPGEVTGDRSAYHRRRILAETDLARSLADLADAIARAASPSGEVGGADGKEGT